MDMNNFPAIIGFYGYSQSGKTTLIREILERLKRRGINIGVVKITDQYISSEAKEKDTYKCRASGALITSFSSKLETNFVINQPLPEEKIIKNLIQIAKVDLILVEGTNDPDVPKIRIGDRPLRENTLFTFTGSVKKVEDAIIEILKKKGIE